MIKDQKLTEIVNRVVINNEGEAVNPNRAETDHGITPDIVFIRNDGWTLGAPKQFKDIAYQMWQNDWEYFYNSTNKELHEISEYER